MDVGTSVPDRLRLSRRRDDLMFAGSRAGSPRPIGVRVIASTEVSVSGVCCELEGA